MGIIASKVFCMRNNLHKNRDLDDLSTGTTRMFPRCVVVTPSYVVVTPSVRRCDPLVRRCDPLCFSKVLESFRKIDVLKTLTYLLPVY